MKLSAHANITNPKTGGYPYIESVKSFANFCDEVVLVDGGTTDGSLDELKKIDKVRIVDGEKWDRDFDWTIIGRNLNVGYLECKGDWTFHFDLDYIFHEDNVDALFKVIESTDLPAIELKKVNFVLVNENFEKDYYPLVVYKKRYPTIRYGVGVHEDGSKSGTFLRPIVRKRTGSDGLEYGDIIKMSNVRVRKESIPIYTYDFTFMTKKQITENRCRFQNALRRFEGIETPISEKASYDLFINMMKIRHKICKDSGKKVKVEEHSRFIREKVKNISKNKFGYDGFGEIKLEEHIKILK